MNQICYQRAISPSLSVIDQLRLNISVINLTCNLEQIEVSDQELTFLEVMRGYHGQDAQTKLFNWMQSLDWDVAELKPKYGLGQPRQKRKIRCDEDSLS